MRIALIGQAPFGAAVFERLVEDGHEIVGVFTPPEREGGRPDPLAQAARDADITLVQPRRWQRRGVVDEDVIAQYEATEPDLNVMAFVTQIIPSRVLEFPPAQDHPVPPLDPAQAPRPLGHQPRHPPGRHHDRRHHLLGR